MHLSNGYTISYLDYRSNGSICQTCSRSVAYSGYLEYQELRKLGSWIVRTQPEWYRLIIDEMTKGIPF